GTGAYLAVDTAGAGAIARSEGDLYFAEFGGAHERKPGGVDRRFPSEAVERSEQGFRGRRSVVERPVEIAQGEVGIVGGGDCVGPGSSVGRGMDLQRRAASVVVGDERAAARCDGGTSEIA